MTTYHQWNRSSRAPNIDKSVASAPLLLKCDDPAVISVQVSGCPLPKVSWFIGSRQIQNSSNYQLTNENDDNNQGGMTCKFSVISVSESLDAGLKILAKNNYGQDECRIPVKTYRLFSSRVNSDNDSAATSKSRHTGDVSTPSSQLKVYHAYNTSLTDNDYRDWSLEMERRSHMRSIDDIFGSDEGSDSEEHGAATQDSAINSRSTDALQHVTTGESSKIFLTFNTDSSTSKDIPVSQTYPRGSERSQPISHISSYSTSLVPPSLRSISKEYGKNPAAGDPLWDMFGEKLSVFCQNLLNIEIPGKLVLTNDIPGEQCPANEIPGKLFIDDEIPGNLEPDFSRSLSVSIISKSSDKSLDYSDKNSKSSTQNSAEVTLDSDVGGLSLMTSTDSDKENNNKLIVAPSVDETLLESYSSDTNRTTSASLNNTTGSSSGLNSCKSADDGKQAVVNKKPPIAKNKPQWKPKTICKDQTSSPSKNYEVVERDPGKTCKYARSRSSDCAEVERKSELKSNVDKFSPTPKTKPPILRNVNDIRSRKAATLPNQIVGEFSCEGLESENSNDAPETCLPYSSREFESKLLRKRSLSPMNSESRKTFEVRGMSGSKSVELLHTNDGTTTSKLGRKSLSKEWEVVTFTTKEEITIVHKPPNGSSSNLPITGKNRTVVVCDIPLDSDTTAVPFNAKTSRITPKIAPKPKINLKSRRLLETEICENTSIGNPNVARSMDKFGSLDEDTNVSRAGRCRSEANVGQSGLDDLIVSLMTIAHDPEKLHDPE